MRVDGKYLILFTVAIFNLQSHHSKFKRLKNVFEISFRFWKISNGMLPNTQQQAFKEDSMGHTQVFEWFKFSDMSVENHAHSSHPSTSGNNEHVENIC